MPSLNPDHVESLIKAINQGPYFRHLSMEVVELTPGHSIVEITIGREHLNPFGGLHGGAYASVIDTAAYWSVYCEMPEKAGLISVDLKVDFLAPVNSGTLIVKGSRIKIGKTICLAEASAFDQNNRLLAHGVSKMIVTQGLQVIQHVIDFNGGLELRKRQMNPIFPRSRPRAMMFPVIKRRRRSSWLGKVRGRGSGIIGGISFRHGVRVG